MIIEQSEHIVEEIKKAFMGKDEIVRLVLMAVYAGGHILLEDSPGVGKTTLALAFSKVSGMDYKRVQFTVDTLPSDITGFTMFNRQTNKFEYHEGAANCNLLLADEINRTSPKTQAALLEAMEERHITVDGVTHMLPEPFVCIATQNPIGSTGTQPLPNNQMDRFMVKLSIGYPSTEHQMKILNARRYSNPLDDIKEVISGQNIVEIQNYLSTVHLGEESMRYLIKLCEETRNKPLVELGVSPRGVYALTKMSRAHALLEGRNYVIPEDIQKVFIPVCGHRLILRPQARVEGITEKAILEEIMSEIKPPKLSKR